MLRQVNLLPEELQKANQLSALRNSAILTVVGTLIAVMAVHFLLAARIALLTKAVNQPATQKVSPEIRSLNNEVAVFKQKRKKFVNENKFLVGMLSKTYSYPNIFELVGNVTADRVWLTRFVIDGDSGLCEMQGKSYNTRLVSEFMLELKKSPYFESLDLTSMEKGKGPKNAVIDFVIKANLR